MFETVKNKIQKQGLINLLQFIVAGTQSPAGYAFVPKAEADKLLKAEPTFLSLDETVKNSEGQIKAVASQVAIDALSGAGSATQTESETKPAPAAMQYDIVTLEVMPPIMRGGHKSDNYPFDQLTVFPAAGNAFFVPATASRPNPAKSLASTVASASKRYVGKGDRVFTVRKHVVDGKVTGAHVIRTK